MLVNEHVNFLYEVYNVNFYKEEYLRDVDYLSVKIDLIEDRNYLSLIVI